MSEKPWNMVCQTFETPVKGFAVESIEAAVADITERFSREAVNAVFLFAHHEHGHPPDLDVDGCDDTQDDEGCPGLAKQVAFERRFCDSYATMRALMAALDRSLRAAGIRVEHDTECCPGLEGGDDWRLNAEDI